MSFSLAKTQTCTSFLRLQLRAASVKGAEAPGGRRGRAGSWAPLGRLATLDSREEWEGSSRRCSQAAPRACAGGTPRAMQDGVLNVLHPVLGAAQRLAHPPPTPPPKGSHSRGYSTRPRPPGPAWTAPAPRAHCGRHACHPTAAVLPGQVLPTKSQYRSSLQTVSPAHSLICTWSPHATPRSVVKTGRQPGVYSVCTLTPATPATQLAR